MLIFYLGICIVLLLKVSMFIIQGGKENSLTKALLRNLWWNDEIYHRCIKKT